MNADANLLQHIKARLAQHNPVDVETPIELSTGPEPAFSHRYSNALKPQVAFGPMELRDALAIAAMPLMSWYREAAKSSPAKCWQIADAMLAARSAK